MINESLYHAEHATMAKSQSPIWIIYKTSD